MTCMLLVQFAILETQCLISNVRCVSYRHMWVMSHSTVPGRRALLHSGWPRSRGECSPGYTQMSLMHPQQSRFRCACRSVARAQSCTGWHSSVAPLRTKFGGRQKVFKIQHPTTHIYTVHTHTLCPYLYKRECTSKCYTKL